MMVDNGLLIIIAILLIVIVVVIILRRRGGGKKRQAPSGSMVIPQRVAINQRTRGAIGPWRNVGILHSESTEDDKVFNLEARSIDRGRFKYEYQVTDKETGVTIELFGGDEVDELQDDDTVTIPGYESKGPFLVLLNSKDEYKYIPY